MFFKLRRGRAFLFILLHGLTPFSVVGTFVFLAFFLPPAPLYVIIELRKNGGEESIMNIFIDDLIRKLIEIRKDGYYYCDIDFLPSDELDGEDEPACLSFAATDDGDICGVDCNDGIEVTEIPDEELEKYGYKNHAPSPIRKVIKDIKLDD